MKDPKPNTSDTPNVCDVCGTTHVTMPLKQMIRRKIYQLHFCQPCSEAIELYRGEYTPDLALRLEEIVEWKIERESRAL